MNQRAWDKPLAEIAAKQDDLVTRADVRITGATDRVTAGRAHRQLWQRPQAGVYLHGAAPPSWLQSVRAAALAFPAAVASHRTAAVLHGLDVDGSHVEFTTPWGRQPALRGVHVYRSRRPVTKAVVKNGVRVTSVERTLVDLAGVVGREDLERAVESALLQRKTTEERIYVALVCEGGRGVRGSKLLWRVMHERPLGRPARSVFEIRTTHLLRRGGLPDFVRNYPVVVDGEAFELDNAFVDEMVVVETDGAAFHSTRTQRDRDRRRQRKLEAAGWRFRRVTYAESIFAKEAVIADVRALLSGAGANARSSRGRGSWHP